MMGGLGLGLALVSLAIWVGLLTLWGQFWRCDQRLESAEGDALDTWPSVWVVIPARNEADVLPVSLRSHLTQTYPGPLHVLLVDDQSRDGTGEVARRVAADLGRSDQLTVLSGSTLPVGWTGKLWAMEQGYRWLQELNGALPEAPQRSSLGEQELQSSPAIDYVLFTDADIEHSPTNLQDLVTKAETERLDLASLMVLLRRETFWETLLIPAFVFFFQMLYPFPLVNHPQRQMAAAAGGCMLLRFSALERIGGLACIRDALIDDCALGAAVKAGGPIWLGLTQTTISLRPYPTLQSIWDMVARSAYTQLRYSPWLLVGTVLGMGLVYLVLPVSFGVGVVAGNGLLAGVGLVGWGLMALAYWPTLKLYDCPPWLAFGLPVIAVLYTLMTVDSAVRHWHGQGGAWKGRVYSG